MTLDAAPKFLTTSEVCLELRIVPNVLRRAIDAGVVAPSKAGRIAVFAESDLTAIRAALLAAGYLRVTGEVMLPQLGGLPLPTC